MPKIYRRVTFYAFLGRDDDDTVHAFRPIHCCTIRPFQDGYIFNICGVDVIDKTEYLLLCILV
ncbi:hypothetical protein D3C87_1261580 [compost metagenome]